MKKFIENLALFSVISLSVLIGLVYRYADGTIDSFYLRFTTPPAHSMILGSSRPAQGIQPQYLEEELDENLYEGPFLNFSFTTENSPFGPLYYEAIVKKLAPFIKNGIFIINVDPWQFAVDSGNPDDPSKYREVSYAPGNMVFLSMDPNFEYLVKNFNGGFREIISNRKYPYRRLHENGWLEISIDTSVTDTEARMYASAESYFLMGKERMFSSTRLRYLRKTISFLGKHGEVFLIQMPVTDPVKKAEKAFLPDFTHRMEKLASDEGIIFYDFSNLSDQYFFIDGHHLYKDDGAQFSKILGKKIQSRLLEK